ncbi:MAG: alpha/beta fold hydrolase [Actinomycetota bacterium]
MDRPSWVRDDLFPFRSHFVDVDGSRIHYIDEGDGPVFLALHGNPTWSFLYRHIVGGLKDRFRCIALDYPGFGLSTAGPGYGYTVAEHARTVESFVTQLDLQGITLMVQDWGGPIGLAVAARHPERFRALVIGNTWGWPAVDDRGKRTFSKLLSSAPGQFAITRLDVFTNVFLRAGMRRRNLTADEFDMYKRPHATPALRRPVAVMPKEILGATELLSEVERGTSKLAHLPALIVWGTKDPGFKAHDRARWEWTFPRHRTVILEGASHYIQEDAPEEIVAAIEEWWPGE